MTPFSLDQPLPTGVALLEASAGTGKTYSIAGLAVRLVAEAGIPIGELLIVTFTRAATAELAARIHARLLSSARALRAHQVDSSIEVSDPVVAALVQVASADELTSRLRRIEQAIAAFDEAAISTIHGFCQRALQSAAFESATEFDVDMEADLGPLIDECIDDFMAARLVTSPPAYYAILRKVNELGREGFVRLGARVVGDPGAQILPADPPDPVALHQAALDAVRELWASEGPDFIEALRAAQKAKEVKFSSSKGYGPKPLGRSCDTIDAWFQAISAGELLPSEGPRALRKLGRRALDAAVTEGSWPEHPLADAIDHLLYAPATALRACFALQLRQSLETAKRERGVLAFDDQIRRLEAALQHPARGPALRELIRHEYLAALIDESQDTDALQWSIFSTLFGDAGRPLYLIGDPKQAIYGFRGADIATYLAAREAARGQQFGLRTNWRSDAPLVEALNGLYARAPQLAPGIEVPEVGAAPGHEASALVGASLGAPLVVRHFPQNLAGTSARGKQPYSSSFAAAQAMARPTALEVTRLLSEGIELRRGETQRPLHAGDIAILVDTHQQAAAVEAALGEFDLPCVRGGHGSVFRSEAAGAVHLWLEAVQQVRNSGSVRALMLSALVGMSSRELDELDELEWENWAERVANWRRTWREQGFLRAWSDFAESLDLQARLLAKRGGSRLYTDTQQIARLLHEAESSARLSPSALVRWFGRWPDDRQLDDAHALTLERDDPAVTITTLHASKGLEYGIVLCPIAWSAPRPIKPATLRVRVEDADPPWLFDLRDEAHEPQKAVHIELAERAALEEHARKLYVALTRARHQLIVYWGAFDGATESSLARLLFADTPAPALRALDDETRLAQLEDLAETLGTRMALAANDELTAGSYTAPSAIDPEGLAARPFTRHRLDRNWRRSSYSSLSRGAHFIALDQLDDESPEAEGIDHDAVAARTGNAVDDTADDTTDDTATIVGADQVPLAAFERGAAAGTFLHEVLEFLDFELLDDRPAVVELCEQTLVRHGLPRAQGLLIARALSQALRTPLRGPLGDWSLAQLTRGDRVDEMQFDLPLAGGYAPSSDRQMRPRVDGAALARLFAQHRAPQPGFSQAIIDHYASMRFERPLRGFLTGAIDLFFRAPDAEGHPRYFVADYKSNWLGAADRKRSNWAHYNQAALSEAMTHHDYHLQYHLYVLAVHRYLRSRLGPSYDYERDFGGAYYLFVRGMPGDDRHHDDAAGWAPGVFFDRPPLAFVDALDELFTTGGSDA